LQIKLHKQFNNINANEHLSSKHCEEFAAKNIISARIRIWLRWTSYQFNY